jgi:hypothetical protein
MKRLLPIIAILIFSASCDSPRSTRSVLTSSKSDGLNYATPTNMTTPGVDLGATTTTTSATVSTNVPADASHCKFSADGVNGFESTSSHLGPYTLCQSSSDKNIFYAQIKTPPVGSSGDVSVCFIPHTTSGSNSIYVGNPMCGRFTDPRSVQKISFVKYTNYSSALINNVMFFKDTSYYYSPPYNSTEMTLNAYKICMNKLSYRVTTFCETFKSVGQYVMKSF